MCSEKRDSLGGVDVSICTRVGTCTVICVGREGVATDKGVVGENGAATGRCECSEPSGVASSRCCVSGNVSLCDLRVRSFHLCQLKVTYERALAA